MEANTSNQSKGDNLFIGVTVSPKLKGVAVGVVYVSSVAASSVFSAVLASN